MSDKSDSDENSSENLLAEDNWVDEKVIEKAREDGVDLVFDRYQNQQPQCNFGLKGVCCKKCWAGPCRIIEGQQDKGICGATIDTIVARNFLRHTAAGTAAHTDHAKENIHTLLKIGKGKTDAYQVEDEQRLREIADELGINEDLSIEEMAEEIALEAFEDYRRQEGLFHKSEGSFLNWATNFALPKRVENWKDNNILPVNADKQTSHVLHQTHMGCDAEPEDIWLSVLRTGVADGYGGLRMATDMQDIIFGTPSLTKSKSDLSVLDENKVNLVVHGHVPLLSDKIVEWADKLEDEAKEVGAEGINVVGICCTAHEVLMRQGVPIAGHVMQQGMAIATGATDLMVVDTQCIYPAITQIASCYHTKIVSTIENVKIPGAEHIKFEVESADENAKEIVRKAIDNFENRPKEYYIPEESTSLMAGFSTRTIIGFLEKVNEDNPLDPLLNEIKEGNIKGIAALVGCRNPKLKGEKFSENLIEKLISNNILVVTTGCVSHAAAQEGLMKPEAAEKAGEGLRNFLKEVGEANDLDYLPPVLHMGSCVDSSRIGRLLTKIASKLDVDIPDLPAVASAPEYTTEKAVSIGSWALAEGLGVHFNPPPPISGSDKAVNILTDKLPDITGGKVLLGDTPEKAAEVMIHHIEGNRESLF